MKGGVIESGRLEGGIMLSGLLRGGVIKSGIIRGGIIDRGVVVQGNAEIGPGVEIHEGIVKGGRITVSRGEIADSSTSSNSPHKEEKRRTNTPTAASHHHTTLVNRSNIYHIELEDSATAGDATASSKNTSLEVGKDDQANLLSNSKPFSVANRNGKENDGSIIAVSASKKNQMLKMRSAVLVKPAVLRNIINFADYNKMKISPVLISHRHNSVHNVKSSVPILRPRIQIPNSYSKGPLVKVVGGTKRQLFTPVLHLYSPAIRNSFFIKKQLPRPSQLGVRRQMSPQPQPVSQVSFCLV